MKHLRRGLVLVALTAALICAVGGLVSADTGGSGRAVTTSASPTPSARVCTDAHCAPGHNPGVTSPAPQLLAFGGIALAAIALVAPRRVRRRDGSGRVPRGFPSEPYRPPIFA